MAEWTGPALYAPNLIGCGVSEGSDAWNPDERGLSFPLGWAQGCEALMARALTESNTCPWRFSLFESNNNNKKTSRKWTVLAQGGLAPVAILIAARNPETVDKMILTSPPTWKDLTSAVPEAELAQNYNFLRNPLWGNLAFKLLETRGVIEFFSNQFLFADRCDIEWLDRAEQELGLASRPPVISFNAGFCQHRSFFEELCSISQSTLIIAGDGDKRPRAEYAERMKNCRLDVLSGLNVLPWEAPTETIRSIKTFLNLE
jgi:pimeloyl-ACP methyl ester carboxylesterase